MSKNYYQQVKTIVLKNKGQLISDIFEIPLKISKFEIKCEQDHRWFSCLNNLENKQWCKKCYLSKMKDTKRNPEKIFEIRKKAIERGGICLSEDYINIDSKLKFKCSIGHEWETSWKVIKRGAWCRQCNIVNTIELCHKTAAERFGKCLSDKIAKKVKWQCDLGHEWMAQPNNVIAGRSWCPTCQTFLSERICRLYFETIFGKQFQKSRPDWLKNSNGNQLELDGYCEELGIAFEHNGIQHYENRSKFGNDLLKIQNNDCQKIKLCNENNVKLIVIETLNFKTKIENLKKIIKEKCLKQEIKLPANFDQISVDHNNVYQISVDKIYLESAREKAKEKGFTLLSDVYLGAGGKLNYRCNICNYISNYSPNQITILICKNCLMFNRKKAALNKAIKLAISKNGKCLSTSYINNSSKLKWECEKGHIWEAIYNSCQNGHWCPSCANVKRKEKAKILPISVYQEAAKNKGGKCLSLTVSSAHDMLEWQCKEGHIWIAAAYRMKNSKQWCPKCYQNRLKKFDLSQG